MIDVIGLIEYNVYRSSKKKKEKLIRNWKIIRVAGHETDTKKGVKSERVEESTMRKIV